MIKDFIERRWDSFKDYVSLDRVRRDIRQNRSISQDAVNAALICYMRYSALNFTKKGTNSESRPFGLTVSLTSYSRRILDVYLAIESLLQQSLRPDRIVLWLSEKEFSGRNLPSLLEEQKKRGLTVEFCDEIGSYKKIIPSLREYPNDLIITADDDLIYPVDHVERLVSAFMDSKHTIHCHRAHLMKRLPNGDLAPYQDWENETRNASAGKLIFPTSGAGVIYFPDCFHSKVTDQSVFLSLCPTADDVWLKFMSLMAGTNSQLVPYSQGMSRCVIIPGSQTESLWATNQEDNDSQIRAVMKEFGNDLKW